MKALIDGRSVDAVIDLDFSSTADLVPRGVLASHRLLICYSFNPGSVATAAPGSGLLLMVQGLAAATSTRRERGASR